MRGAENAAEMEVFLEDTVYAVRFDFHSGCSGYVGDYFILAGDARAKKFSKKRRREIAMLGVRARRQKLAR